MRQRKGKLQSAITSIKLEIRTPEMGRVSCHGPINSEVAFAIWLLAMGWGSGTKGETEADAAFVASARAFIDACSARAAAAGK